jgi:hypothetical protein
MRLIFHAMDTSVHSAESLLAAQEKLLEAQNIQDLPTRQHVKSLCVSFLLALMEPKSDRLVVGLHRI